MAWPAKVAKARRAAKIMESVHFLMQLDIFEELLLLCERSVIASSWWVQ